MRVRHGNAVEVAGSAYFEGAWDGKFAAMAFPESVTCAGSGGSIRGDSICFAAPSHTLERLFLLRTAATIYVSNSLVFALATADDDVDANYPFYHHDFACVIELTVRWERSVPARNGGAIEQYYCCAGEYINGTLPRRLVEEAGVPREWFGQDKPAVTQPLAFVPREPWLSNLPLANLLSRASLDDFSGYLRSIESVKSKRHPSFAALHAIYTLNQRIDWRLARGLERQRRPPLFE